MKLTVNRAKFINNLNDVLRAISSKTTIPILTGIKLYLEEDGLTLTGSDSDISIEIKIPAGEDLTVENIGSIVLPARFFAEIVKRLPEEEFSFEVVENFQTVIKSGQSEFSINGLDANNYPRLPEVSTKSEFMINSKIFGDVINKTNFAVATQESRPILTGVHFIFEKDEIKAVATDSHRLSQKVVKLENGPELATDLIIPGKSLTELSRIFAEKNIDINVLSSDNQVVFHIDNLTFYSRLLEGTYPETDRLLPTKSTTVASFDIRELANSLDRASLLTHESRNNVVKLSIKPSSNEVILFGNSPEVGNVEEKVAALDVDGEDLEISFNPDYLKIALRAFDEDKVTMNFTQALRPFTVIPKEKNDDFIQLITPVRTF